MPRELLRRTRPPVDAARRAQVAVVLALVLAPCLMLALSPPSLPPGVSRAGALPDLLPFGRGLAADQQIEPLRSGYVARVLRQQPGASLASVTPATAGDLAAAGGGAAAPAAPAVQPLPLERSTQIAGLPNDDVARAYAVGALPFSVRESTDGATREPGEPAGCGGQGTVWFAFTPSRDQSVVVSTFGSSYDAAFSLYRRTGSGLQPVGSCARRLTSVETDGGQTYLIQVTSGAELVLHVVRAPGLGTVTLESRSRTGRPASFLADNPTISTDARRIVFVSGDYDLQDEDPLATPRSLAQVCLRLTLEFTRYSVRPCGTLIYGRDLGTGKITPVDGGHDMRTSADSAVVVYTRGRSVPGESVFMWDRATGRPSQVPRGPDGSPSPGLASKGVVSADGRYVAYQSHAKDLAPDASGDENNAQTYVFDRRTGRTERVSARNGKEPDGVTGPMCLSADGRYVVVTTSATDLGPPDSNDVVDYYRVDRLTGEAVLVSADASGNDANGPSGELQFRTGQCISDDGRYVVFNSTASDLVSGDGNGTEDVFVRDLLTGVTDRVTVSSSGAEANRGVAGAGRWQPTPAGDVCADRVLNVRCDDSSIRFGTSISSDGRFVAFSSDASNLAEGRDDNGSTDVFRHDRLTGQTIVVSRGPDGRPASGGDSFGAPVLALQGEAVLFQSKAANLTSESRAGSGPQLYLWRAG